MCRSGFPTPCGCRPRRLDAPMPRLPTSFYMNWFLPTSTAAAVSQHVALPHTSPRSRPMWCLGVWPTNLLELNSDCGDRTLWNRNSNFRTKEKTFTDPRISWPPNLVSGLLSTTEVPTPVGLSNPRYWSAGPTFPSDAL